MGERDTIAITGDTGEDFFEPALGELSDEELESLDFAEEVTEKALKAAKRRRAEERLEVLRLREELGDYDTTHRGALHVPATGCECVP